MTSVSRCFYQQHLSHRPLRPVDGLVKVVGAAGQIVPVLGYIERNICLEDSGTAQTFPTLVLVVPDNDYNQRVPVIIGTNVIKRCRDAYLQSRIAVQSMHHFHISPVWKEAYDSLRSCEHFESRCSSGLVNVHCTLRHPVTIAAHQTVVLWGLAPSAPGNSPQQVIIEPPPGQNNGLTVTPVLTCLTSGGIRTRVPVEVTNNSTTPIKLAPGAVLASLQVASEVLLEPPSTKPAKRSSDPKVDLSDTTLSAEQKDQVHELLTRMSHVFAKDSTDMCRTSDFLGVCWLLSHICERFCKHSKTFAHSSCPALQESWPSTQ